MDKTIQSSFSIDAISANILPLRSNLYMIEYNGELIVEKELEAYKFLNDFSNLTIHQLNRAPHVDYKSISIGHLIKDIYQEDPCAQHNCSSLPGSSGSVMLDYYGKLVGIHIGISNSKRQKNNQIFFTKETFNKYISIYSNQFQKFIAQTVLPNMNDDQGRNVWLFYSK